MSPPGVIGQQLLDSGRFMAGAILRIKNVTRARSCESYPVGQLEESGEIGLRQMYEQVARLLIDFDTKLILFRPRVGGRSNTVRAVANLCGKSPRKIA